MAEGSGTVHRVKRNGVQCTRRDRSAKLKYGVLFWYQSVRCGRLVASANYICRRCAALHRFFIPFTRVLSLLNMSRGTSYSQERSAGVLHLAIIGGNTAVVQHAVAILTISLVDVHSTYDSSAFFDPPCIILPDFADCDSKKTRICSLEWSALLARSMRGTNHCMGVNPPLPPHKSFIPS